MRVLMVTAIYPTPENPGFGAFVPAQIQALEQAGVETELLVLQGSRRKLAYLKGIVQLRRRLMRGGIDLVHAHYSYAGMVARAQWQVPVVVSFCGTDLLGMVDTQGRETRLSKVSVAAGRMLSHIVDAVIVKSAEMAGKVSRSDVHVIPNEVDFDVFRPLDRERARALLGLEPEKKYLLFAAKPQNIVKRFPLANAAVDILHARDSSVELLAVYKETQDRLALYMNACDALVFTSFQEGSPNIIKQAMACNLPIVATDVGDIREVIGATVGCHICAPAADAFAERLDEVLRSRQRTQGWNEIQHLARPAVAQKILKVYQETLKQHESRRNGTMPNAV